MLFWNGFTRYFHSVSPQCLCPDWWMNSMPGLIGCRHDDFMCVNMEGAHFNSMALFCTWATLCVIMLGHIGSFNSAGGPLFVRFSQWHSQQWFSQCTTTPPRSKTKLTCATFSKAGSQQSPFLKLLSLFWFSTFHTFHLCVNWPLSVPLQPFSPVLCRRNTSPTEWFSLPHTWIYDSFSW